MRAGTSCSDRTTWRAPRRQDDVARAQALPHAHARGGQGDPELGEDLLAQRHGHLAQPLGLGIEHRLEVGAHLEAPRRDERHERRLARAGAGALLRGRLGRSAAVLGALGPGARPPDEQERPADDDEGRRRQPRHDREQQHEDARHL
jgi:hypothetical protein